uniref:Uncharacterized protein n=1 Tax=Brassica oleracea TaxID=3712 RepID=A0A3P6FLD1_BRAOL|nr:unnamed protein product [Brassica oleracea]
MLLQIVLIPASFMKEKSFMPLLCTEIRIKQKERSFGST